MATGNDYYHLRAWCQMMGSDVAYTRRQIEAARADGAPRDAIYKREDGTWAAFSDVTAPETRVKIGRLLGEQAGAR